MMQFYAPVCPIADTSELGVSTTMRLGLRPAISWYARANKVNRLATGRVVGYDQTYKYVHASASDKT